MDVGGFGQWKGRPTFKGSGKNPIGKGKGAGKDGAKSQGQANAQKIQGQCWNCGKTVNTTPNPRIRRTPAHVIFSRVAQDLSHRVHRNRCESQNSHSLHQAQHVGRTPVVVSFTLEHYLTFHMHFSPIFYQTIYQTFIDVYFTRRFILRRSIKCVFRSPG